MAPRGRELSEDLKKRVIELHKNKVGYKTIAKTLLLSRNTVVKVIQRFKSTGTVVNKQRLGSPHRLSQTAVSHITNLALKDRHMSASQLAEAAAELIGAKVSKSTVRRILYRSELQRPHRKPVLKQQHKKARDVQQLLVQQERRSSLDQEEPEPSHIKKEEQKELWISQDGEQLQDMEEADTTMFTLVPMKSEEDEEEVQSSQLQNQTEERRESESVSSSSSEQIKRESDGEPARNTYPGIHLRSSSNDKASLENLRLRTVR
ncbi:hypothetical protein LDENG_00226560 [Lucifuga dentata]|nr:hypothetical protein LDENG_00226560 [Lucifuga dentata]